ncbi:toll/interleukin-1 receptor domain-containing protein, partial [Streptococcus anginosus]|uniref:toll/interleukin-1 receptor domain-containing protein n=1 Tax=Streptococcus anginosus TaxID=1328 RepID=UPI0034D284E4
MPPGQGPVLSVPVSLYAPLMASDSTPHVFISYRHEDAAAVDELCSMLQAAEIPYWRDRDELGPGDMWEMKIKQA